MIQEYISRTWLLQNIREDMKTVNVMQTLVNAPIVEFDAEELHNLRSARYHLRRFMELMELIEE